MRRQRRLLLSFVTAGRWKLLTRVLTLIGSALVWRAGGGHLRHGRAAIWHGVSGRSEWAISAGKWCVFCLFVIHAVQVLPVPLAVSYGITTLGILAAAIAYCCGCINTELET
jgi:hypothetical protein